MDGQPVDLERRVALLEGALRDLSVRLAALENGATAPREQHPQPVVASTAAAGSATMPAAAILTP
ncbi:MAG: hypothetical protein WCC53_12850, partial [Thermoanaerobaculia bacterium]